MGEAEHQRERAEGLKDTAHASDTVASHNSVDAFKGQPPTDDIGGTGKQHTCGEHTTWIENPTVWATATASLMEHPRVKEALASEAKVERIKDIPIDDILGSDGHRQCDGYSLVADGFNDVRVARDNRWDWIQEIRKTQKENTGMRRAEAEVLVEEKSADGRISAVKPQVERIDSFEGGNFQVNFKRNPDGPGRIVSTIFVNPPDRTDGMEDRS